MQYASAGRGVLVYVRCSKTDQDGTASDVRYLKNGCAVAQWEREATAERTSAALQVLKQQGRATGGVAPYGFQFIDGRRAWHQAGPAQDRAW